MATCAEMLRLLDLNRKVVSDLLNEHDIVSACLQAAETEHSARIGASAARQAGTMALAAALAAICAAAVAYIAAKMQVRLAQHEHSAKRLAYRRRIHGLAVNCLVELKNEFGRSFELACSMPLDRTISLLAECSPDKWEIHSIMGDVLPMIDDTHKILILLIISQRRLREVFNGGLITVKLLDIDHQVQTKEDLLRQMIECRTDAQLVVEQLLTSLSSLSHNSLLEKQR